MLSKTKRSGSEAPTPFGSRNADFVLLPGQSGEKSETIWRESASSAFAIFAEAMQAPGKKPKKEAEALACAASPEVRSVPLAELSPHSAIVIS
jgi:hypothetical protein